MIFYSVMNEHCTKQQVLRTTCIIYVTGAQVLRAIDVTGAQVLRAIDVIDAQFFNCNYAACLFYVC